MVSGKTEYVRQLKMQKNSNIKGCYPFDISQHVNYIINDMQIYSNYFIQDFKTFVMDWNLKIQYL